MGPGRSSSLRIGGDSSVISDSGWISGASDRLVGVVFRDIRGNLLSPWIKARVELMRINTPWDRNI